jgi:hypothetical protein
MIDLDASSKITLYALLWGGLLLVALARNGGSRHGSIGLPLAFLANYTLAHAGALLQLIEGYDHTQDGYLRALSYTSQTVADGLEASWLGMFGATIGFFLAEYAIGASVLRRSTELPLVSMRRGSMYMLTLGMAIMLLETVMARMGITLAGFQAVLANGRNLIIVGTYGLVLYEYAKGGTRAATIVAGAFALLLPAVALITRGILADSVGLGITVLAFYLTLRRPGRRPLARDIAIFATVTVLAVIFASAYMQFRDTLRSVISSGGDIGAAVSTVAEAAGNFDMGSIAQEEPLARLDSRLNQNIFIGLAIEQLRILPDTYENGQTILLALFGWVPRFLWPGKPERGGASFIGKHTGKQTAEGTTFGAGPIFEFYVNYAYVGVLAGFMVIGAVLRALDIAAFNRLRAGIMDRFAQYSLVALPLMQPLADLFFTVSAMAAALVLSLALRLARK